MITIRKETKNDINEIYAVVKTAFETAKVKDGTEQDIVNTIRGSGRYVPELSIVALDGGKIAGHIMFSTSHIMHDGAAHETLIIAPLSVLIEYRSKGIGSKLMKAGCEQAAALGYRSVFLFGDPLYYTRFGYKAAGSYGITPSIDMPEELLPCFMALELVHGELSRYSGGCLKVHDGA